MLTELYERAHSHTPSPMAKQNWIYVTSVSHYRHTADDIPFYRDYAHGFQMFYTVSGQGWLDYEGSFQKVIPGTVTCVDLGKKHGFGAEPGGVWEHYWLICHGKAFKDIYSLIFNKNNTHKLLDSSLVSDYFKKLYYLKQNNSVYFDIDAMTIIMKVCSALVSQSTAFDKKQDTFSAMLTHIIDYINKNYSQDLDISGLAEKAGYSRFHFSRLFKEYTGFSPSSYITKIRLEKAKDMLRKSDIPLELVAAKAGFNTVNYFIRSFNEHEGITPGKYRKIQSF